MTHRTIKDGDGKSWEVWEVYPSVVEQRVSGEYPAMPNTEGLTAERRERREIRILVPSALQQGWLAFQAGDERRRLAPIPENWSAFDNAALIALLERADRLTDGNSR